MNADGTDAEPRQPSWTVTAPAPPVQNLLSNGDFETAKTGWYALQAASHRCPAAPGHQGRVASRSTATATSYQR